MYYVHTRRPPAPRLEMTTTMSIHTHESSVDRTKSRNRVTIGCLKDPQCITNREKRGYQSNNILHFTSPVNWGSKKSPKNDCLIGNPQRRRPGAAFLNDTTPPSKDQRVDLEREAMSQPELVTPENEEEGTTQTKCHTVRTVLHHGKDCCVEMYGVAIGF